MYGLEQFIAKARERHGDRFSYDKFVYVSAKTAGTITCKTHGDFLQKPDHHLRRETTNACQKCWADRRKTIRKGIRLKCSRAKIPPEEFVRRARARYGSRYEYDMTKYVGLCQGSVDVTCPEHGTFTVAPPKNHLAVAYTTGCPACGAARRKTSKTKTFDAFVTKAHVIHAGKYAYPDSGAFVNRRSKITIVCPEHGPSQLAAQKHLAGQGCWPCKVGQLISDGRLPGGYSSDVFDQRPDVAACPAVLYYLRIGEKYKIGVSTNLPRRLASLRSAARKSGIVGVTVLAVWDGSLRAVYDCEQAVLKTFSRFRRPSRFSSELFDSNILELPEFKQATSILEHSRTPIPPETSSASR